MRQLTKLFPFLIAAIFMVVLPSQGQIVTLNVAITNGPSSTATLTAVDGVAQFTSVDVGGCLNAAVTSVVGGGSLVGNLIVVAPAAVSAHLAHGDVLAQGDFGKKVGLYHKPVGSAATATLTYNDDGTVTVTVSGVTSDCQVDVTGTILE